MKKIAAMVIDQVDEGGKKIAAKDYALIVVDGFERHKKFPIDTPENVKESAQALEKNAGKIPDEFVKVAKYHIDVAHKLFFGKPAFENVEKVGSRIVDTHNVNWFAFEKKANEERVYAWKNNKLPITTESELRDGMRWFVKYARQLSIDARRQIAKNLVKRAKELGVDPDGYVVKQAGDTFNSTAKLSLMTRILRTPDIGLKEKYAQLLEDVENNRVELMDAITKLATYDAMNDPRVLHGLRDAYDTLVGTEERKKTASPEELDEKIAEKLKDGVTVNDLSVSEKKALGLL